MAEALQRYRVGAATIELIRGDIVEQDVDAVVNAANEQLAAGGGVCGAIFRAAGYRELEAACDRVAPCPTGEARLTPGFRLKARHIIHAVGPIYQRRDPAGSARLLAGAYRSSLALAQQHCLASIALPSISTGIFGYPVAEAAGVALGVAADLLSAPGSLALVRWVLWDAASYEAYAQAAQALGLTPAP
jgi:O-acetyl-ADP-ribose deacetylase (regulator of RNase III)